jgi:hypothetical protein
MSKLNVGTINTTTGVKLPSYTSGNRPANPEPGLLIFNTSSNLVEIWNGTSWTGIQSSPPVASGGTITDIDGYRIHVFTGNGTFTVSQASPNSLVDYLIVGGGGGGGVGNANEAGGGGGGGGYIFGSFLVSVTSYPVVVGAGGSGGSGGGSGGSGSSSSVFGYTALGGGSGAGCSDSGGNGGSGGGGSGCGTDRPGGRALQIESGIGQGNNGGAGRWVGYAPNPGNGGGGGGALSSGVQGRDRPPQNIGGGGLGIPNEISGSLITYSYGGDGGQGQGGSTGHSGVAGIANTGGGGAGTVVQSAPAGGSGVVIIRYKI